MKKFVALLLAIVLAVSVTVLLPSCSELSKMLKKEGVDRYDLADMDFLEISSDQYEYNYVEFDHNSGTYELENKVKANGIVTKQSGKFTVEDDVITFTNDDVPSMNYIMYPGETAYFEGDKLHIEASIDGVGDVSMTFEK